MAQEFVPRKQQRQTQAEKWNYKFSIPFPQIKMYNLNWRSLALCRPNQRGFFWAYVGGLCKSLFFSKDLIFYLTRLFLA